MQYAGPAPFQVAGVSQINFTIPNGGFPVELAAGHGSCAFNFRLGL